MRRMVAAPRAGCRSEALAQCLAGLREAGKPVDLDTERALKEHFKRLPSRRGAPFPPPPPPGRAAPAARPQRRR